MKQEIKFLMEQYDYLPSFILSDDLIGVDYTKETMDILNHLEIRGERLNPMDVVIESLLNVKMEEISSKFTKSRDRFLANKEIFERAVREITRDIGDNPETIKEIHATWLSKLKIFLGNLIQKRKKLKIDEAIFLVSTTFRISTLSAIKAISAVYPRNL